MAKLRSLGKSCLFWLLLATFFKGIVWSGVIPLWHFPDEQAHFAQLQNIAERKRIAHMPGISTSREIYESEVSLGTLRDEQGNNRFTFHSDFNLSYTNSFIGEAESRIQSLPMASRQNYSIGEATSYPFLYYALGGLFYWLSYSDSLFTRVFLVRIFSVLLTVATVWLAYKIGKLIFKKELWAVSLGVLVSFQPMFTFVGAGVNSDVLFNLFFTLFIAASLMFLEKPSLKAFCLVVLSLTLGFMTKQQMAVALLLSPFPLVFGLLRTRKQRHHTLAVVKIGAVVASLLLMAFFVGNFGEVYRIRGFIVAAPDGWGSEINLIDHLIWTVRHTIAEILPWYWGVFKWLGVVLPRWVNRVQMRILGLVVLGLLVYGLKIVKQKKIRQKDWQIGFLALIAITYFLAVTLWNWRFRIAYGFPFGVQGRYFFPAIAAHMSLIIIGLTNLVPKSFERWLLLLFSGWWLVLSLIGLWIVIVSYYQVWPLQTLWWQISQYKPVWFKAQWWFIWLGGYLITLIGFAFSYLRVFQKKNA